MLGTLAQPCNHSQARIHFRRIGMDCKLRHLMLLAAIVLVCAPAVAQTSNPCAGVPGVCHPTWDPVTRCCISDPRFDCVDFCFSSASSPAISRPSDLAQPFLSQLASQAPTAPSDPAAAAISPVSGLR